MAISNVYKENERESIAHLKSVFHQHTYKYRQLNMIGLCPY